jgi:DNA-binding NarL/FixJ family response regulator
MPERNGIELIPDIRAMRPALRILIVTMHLDRVLADTVMHAGANGFIPKDSGLEELEEAIDAVLAGKRYVSPRVPAITWSAGLGADNPVLATLTPRQRDILGMIADGKSSAEMAAALGVSQPTITFHRANLRRKLGVDTEWGLVRFAILMQVRENDRDGAG